MACFRLKLIARFVIGNGVFTPNDLVEFPFLRFDAIKLDYNIGFHLIANKCETFVNQLQKFPRLNEANSICVLANISQKRRGYFIDHTQLLEHLHNQLLSIFGYCRRFEFRIGLGSDNGNITNIIASILEMQQVDECSNVAIHLDDVKPTYMYKYRLPIETISNWLHRNRNTDNGGNEFANQNHQKRVLEIEVALILNVLEMVNHLKEVLFICL